MALEFRILGPPGTGKSTFLKREVERRVEEGTRPDKITITSFTRAAASVIAERVALPRQNVSTLHALAYRAMGSPPIAEVDKLRKEWNELVESNNRYPDSFKIEGQAPEVDSDTASRMFESESKFDEYNLLRAIRQTERVDRVRSNLAGAQAHRLGTLEINTRFFAQEWEAFKADHFAVDFADMIDYALNDMDTCPGDPEILIVDEAQDLVPAQWAVMRKWGSAESVERFIVAGDPAQVLYGFAGARVDDFMTELPEERIRQLPQSYRMPARVLDFAEGVLSAHSGALAGGRHYLPREERWEGDVGRVMRSEASWERPEPLLPLIESDLAENRTVMLLTTSAYMLGPVIRLLRRAGIPFWNPYRFRAAGWNPLGVQREGQTRTVDRVLAFLKVQDPELGGPDAHWEAWTPAEFTQIAGLLKATGVFRKRGARKAALDGLVEVDEVMDGYHPFVSWREEPLFTDEAMAAMYAGDMSWLREHAQKANERIVNYVAEVIERRGRDALTEQPRVVVGTVHSVKGAEADCVYVFPDFSGSAWREIEQSQREYDAALRVYYVALSRAREDVTICAPSYGGTTRTLSEIGA